MRHRVDETEEIVRNLGLLKTILSHWFDDFLVNIYRLKSNEGSMSTSGTPRGQRAANQAILRPLGPFLELFSSLKTPCDNSEVSVRARSFVTTHLIETVLWHRMIPKTLVNARIQCQRRKTSPRTSESDKNWPLWTEKCPWSGEVISYLVILDFKIFFSGE